MRGLTQKLYWHSIIIFLFMPVCLFTQERCLDSGKKNRYAQKQISEIEFSIKITSNPPNFFVASGSEQQPYIQFGEIGRGLRVFDKNGEKILSDTTFTSLNQSYQVKIHSNKLFRNNIEVFEFTESVQTISIGTFAASACVTLSDWDGWEFVGDGWPDAPARLDTFYTDMVILSWTAGNEPDLAGHDIRYWKESELKRQIIVPMPVSEQTIPVEIGQYHFEVAAFDTAGYYSAFVDPVVYIANKQTDTILPDSLKKYDIWPDGEINIKDSNHWWTIFLSINK